jgi:hypothetical protein
MLNYRVKSLVGNWQAITNQRQRHLELGPWKLGGAGGPGAETVVVRLK